MVARLVQLRLLPRAQSKNHQRHGKRSNRVLKPRLQTSFLWQTEASCQILLVSVEPGMIMPTARRTKVVRGTDLKRRVFARLALRYRSNL
jgi:hypothetical protein